MCVYIKISVQLYNSNVHLEVVRLIFGPHIVFVGPSEARIDLIPRSNLSHARKMNINTIITHSFMITST